MADNILNIPAAVTKIETTPDRGLKLTILTQELTASARSLIFGFHQKLGYFCFAEREIPDEVVAGLPEFKAEFKGEKTPAQRLRAVFYRIWERRGRQGSFDEYYKARMEEIIEHFKKGLRDE